MGSGFSKRKSQQTAPDASQQLTPQSSVEPLSISNPSGTLEEDESLSEVHSLAAPLQQQVKDRDVDSNASGNFFFFFNVMMQKV